MSKVRADVCRRGAALPAPFWLMALGVALLHCGGQGQSDAPVAARPAPADVDDTPAGSASAPAPADVGSGNPPAQNDGASSCGCPSSDALRLLRCDDGAGLAFPSVTIEVNPRGDAAIFHQCFERDGQLQTRQCLGFRWTLARGTELLTASNGWLLGLADDGTALIATEVNAPANTAPFLVRLDGSRIQVPLDTNARLAADGRVVGFVPPVAVASSESTSFSPADVSRGPLARWSPPATEAAASESGPHELIDGREYDLSAPGLDVLASLPAEVLADGLVYDVSADASVIVGGGTGVVDGFARGIPLLWTASAGLRVLDGAPSEVRGTALQYVSRDGSAMMGAAEGDDSLEWFQWTELAGFRHVIRIEPYPNLGGGIAFSADGSAFAATGVFSNMSRAYRWSEVGISWIGPDDAPSSTADMSGDGRVVIGTVVD
ncbi:MAG TPA: hypothetical protein VMG12_03080, partial [Polyangiaceae bacterium]|nr:hypothetical protein [Polyangiaceae bacterium]